MSYPRDSYHLGGHSAKHVAEIWLLLTEPALSGWWREIHLAENILLVLIRIRSPPQTDKSTTLVLLCTSPLLESPCWAELMRAFRFTECFVRYEFHSHVFGNSIVSDTNITNHVTSSIKCLLVMNWKKLNSIFQATGLGGNTSLAHDTSGKIASLEKIEDRLITVKFNADVASSMQWNFKPQQTEIKVCLSR